MKHPFPIIIVALIVCILIYVFCRPDDVLIHKIASLILSDQVLTDIRSTLTATLPQWFIYSLPGALWLFSALVGVGSVDAQLTAKKRHFIMAGVIAIPVLMEVCQWLHWTDGTFDVIDLFFIACGAIGAYLMLRYTRNMEQVKLSTVSWKWVAFFFIAILIFGDEWNY